MDKVAVVLTCHNRKQKTVQCIQSLLKNPGIDFYFVVVDDGSKDQTKEALEQIPKIKLKVITGNGSLFWAGGMREGLNYVLQQEEACDFVLLVNDDVVFLEHAVADLIGQSEGNVVAGAVCDRHGNTTYGGIQYKKRGIQYLTCNPGEHVMCDTFNANCVLIPSPIFRKAGNLDEHYRHSLADFDYGLSIKRLGFEIISSIGYVGVCEKNNKKGTWQDTSLTRMERIKKKESVKGAPAGPWFYYLKKNFGLGKAMLFSITPFIRILSKK